MRSFISSFSFFFCCAALAADHRSTLSDDFEGSGNITTLSYSVDSNGLLFSYRSSTGKAYNYNVAKYDECSTMTLFRVPRTHEVAIDGSCSSQGGQIYSYIYEWRNDFSQWCLKREISGEKASFASGQVVPEENVARVKSCYEPGNEGPFTYESDTDVKREIDLELTQFRKHISNVNAVKDFISSLRSYDVFELRRYIDAETVRDINDVAFFLLEAGRSDEAISLLQPVVKKFPHRAVAKLNLADAYWDNDFKALAIPLYSQYKEMMTSDGLGSQVPARVITRLNK
ncbi:tetratricopeptide repeat protein [Caballeronia glebae]|uniref:tetratricopeptide repeat protein n=1 Tax=Caballeronia glebae TaxID=1777143 RepID=UPI0038B94193